MVQLSRPGWRIAAASTSLLVSVVIAPTLPAQAHKSHPPTSPKVVATGLNSPRHLTWENGALYVVEAGKGGSGPCFAGPEGGQVCYGASGSITRLKRHRQSRVVKGLPSLADDGTGENAIGASDVLINGRRYTVAIGLGADPSLRPTAPRNATKLATVSIGKFGDKGLKVVADIARFEDKVNPAGDEKDTNPVGLLQRRGRTFVVDAGGNSLLKLGKHGKVRTTAIFPNTDVPFGGGTFSMDAVPTAAATGPDGAIYVSQLTGFPFPKGGASIWRVVAGHDPVKYATGLTNVTDLAFAKDGSLYAVQITNEGLAAPVDPNPGSVVRIPAGGGNPQPVIGNLTAPYGIALHHGSAYVTTCSVCPGGGEVLRVPLRRS